MANNVRHSVCVTYVEEHHLDRLAEESPIKLIGHQDSRMRLNETADEGVALHRNPLLRQVRHALDRHARDCIDKL